MKIYELNRNDRFKAKFYNQETNEEVLEITGTFLGMDGMYAKYILDGVDYTDETPYSWCENNLEVEEIIE